MRESPSTIVIDELQNLGLNVVSFDPHIKENKHATQTQNLEEATANADILLFLTDHNEFKTIDVTSIKAKNKIVFDTKNCLDRGAWEAAGFEFHLLGDAKTKHNRRAGCICALLFFMMGKLLLRRLLEKRDTNNKANYR